MNKPGLSGKSSQRKKDWNMVRLNDDHKYIKKNESIELKLLNKFFVLIMIYFKNEFIKFICLFI